MPDRSAITLWRRWGGRRLLAAGVATVALLAAAERGGRWLATRWGAATGGAAWIWSADAQPGRGPASFVAARDFELYRPPASARLLALADEECQIFLNGSLVGLQSYRDGDSVTEYEVGGLLLPGANRLFVELRSGRGSGGFVLALVSGSDGRRLVATDREWRILRQFGTELLDPETAIPVAQPAAAVAAAPFGRWGLARGDGTTPLFEERLVEPAGRLPRRARGEGAESWTRLESVDWNSPPLGRRVVFDWGEEVTAYPNLVFGVTREARALFWTGSSVPRTERRPPAGWVVKLDGTRAWSAGQPHRFRYLAIESDQPLLGARAFLIDPRDPGTRLADEGAPRGVFGLDPLPSRTPAEDEIRGELERLESVAVGEGL